MPYTAIFNTCNDYLTALAAFFPEDYISGADYVKVPKATRMLFLNIAREEVAKEFDLYPNTWTFKTAVGKTSYNIWTEMPDLAKESAVRYDGGEPLEKIVDQRDLDYWRTVTDQRDSGPRLYAIIPGRTIELFPPPAEIKAVTVTGWALPVGFTATGDTETIASFFRLIVLYRTLIQM